MVRPQETRFWQAVLLARLTTTERLASCWEEIPVEKRTPDAIDRRLARQTVEAGLLSRWQAQQLFAGVKPRSLWYDRYVLVDLLGQGGMGQVFLAHDSRLNRLVALKVLSRERTNNPRARARFRREARIGAQLQHENLIRIYDEGEAAGHLYLVMEYIEGKSVGHLIAERGPLPAGVAARIAWEVALGLDHASQKGLIHRDVNPQNILIARNGVAKLTDLGLAIDLDDVEQVTRDGTTVGTFDYISPEQAHSSRELDVRSDLYSLGCSFYHMVTGQVPFQHQNLAEKLRAHQALNPTPPSTIVPGIAPELEQVMLRLLAKVPADRYATAHAAAAAIGPFHGPLLSLDEIERAPKIPIRTSPEGTDDSPADAPARDQATTTPAARKFARAVDTPDVAAAGAQVSDTFGIFTRINANPITPVSDTSTSTGNRSMTEHISARLGASRGILIAVLASVALSVLGTLLFIGGIGARNTSVVTDSGEHESPVSVPVPASARTDEENKPAVAKTNPSYSPPESR